MKDKLERFVKILNIKNEVSFYLFNVKYTIINNSNSFIIKQSGSSYIHTYPKIDILFKEYKVYGISLAELFEDIIILEKR